MKIEIKDSNGKMISIEVSEDMQFCRKKINNRNIKDTKEENILMIEN